MKQKKLLSLLLALAMVFSMAMPALAAEGETATPYTVPADVSGKLVVIHTNDTHGHDVAAEGETIGTAGVAALKREFEAAGASVLLLSAGDFSQGTTLVSLDKGASAVDFMNAAGYDAATLGNHEFDYKMDALKANVAKAEFPILAANIVDETTKKPLTGDHMSFDTAIGKVGVFGLDTPETMTKAHPDNVKGLSFYQGEELVKCAQAQVDALKADGCEYIIALVHLGVDPESEPNRSTDVFDKVTGVDVVIDGHSHSELDGSLKAGAAIVVSTGEYLENVGVVITDGTETTAKLVSAAEYTKVDADVAALVDAKNEAVLEEMSKSFGKTEVDLNGERAPGVRTMETNLGDFATDALLWQAKQNLGEDKVDAALTNGGGIRASIPAGEITMNDMKTVFPFGNTVVTIDVTGAQLLEALEAATCSTPTAIGAFPQVAGIEFSIDTSATYENGEMYEDSTYYAPANPGSRVTIATVGGEAFDAEAVYTVATNDFTAAGGDTYSVFKDAANVTMTAVAMEDALINYTNEVLGGVISAEQYGAAQGRIAVKYIGVDGAAWYAAAAKYVMDAGMMSSTGNGFDPSATVTRATVFQTLYNIEGKPAVTEAASFSDVAGKWYADSAAWAEDEGLATGDGTGAYAGDRAVTRAELSTIIWRYMDSPTGQKKAIITKDDYLSVPAWAYEAMDVCLQEGIISGKPGNLLDPNGTAIRSELATVLMNYDQMEPSDTVTTEAYTATTVSIPNGEREVPAIVTIPTGEGPFAAVVMNHGHGGSKDENVGFGGIAAALAEQGIASIRMDFPGCGDSTASFTENTLSNMVSDSNAALAYLLENYPVDKDQLGIMGYSMGGLITAEIVAQKDSPYQAAVLLSGVLVDGKTLAPNLFGSLATYNELKATAQKNGYADFTTPYGQVQQLSKEWFADLEAADGIADIKKYTAPLMVLYGDQDEMVTPKMNQTIVDAMPKAEVVVVPNADHGYGFYSDQPEVTAAVEGSMVTFFAKHLQDKTAGVITAVEKYGHVVTTIAIPQMEEQGYAFGDILTVTFDNGYTLDAPYLPDYFVEQGDFLVRAYQGHTHVAVCINYGKLNEVAELDVGDGVAISMKEKAGYLVEYEMYQLERTNVRDDYASDEEFANFRPIVLGDIAEGMLYRSSSPVNPELGRAAHADDLAEKAGIATFINLADSKENLEGYFTAEGFDSPYYKSAYDAGSVCYLNMPVAYTTEEFATKLGQGLIFMTENEGPYLVHCNEGKDRAGFTAALLEALMGASLEEIQTDYMQSYLNYYGVEKGSEKYNLIRDAHINAMLRAIAGLEKGADLADVDLQKAAETYIMSCGLTAGQVDALQTALSTPVAAPAAA